MAVLIRAVSGNRKVLLTCDDKGRSLLSRKRKEHFPGGCYWLVP